METKLAVAQLAALAQDSRLAIFRWLVERGSTGAYAGEIAVQLAIAPATLSFHLKTLSHAGLVQAAASGRHIRYKAHFVAMRQLIDHLTENCCAEDPTGPASACCPMEQT